MLKKICSYLPIIFITILTLSGCTVTADKIPTVTLVYGVITIASLLLVAGYCCLLKKRELWLLLLYIAVFIVNVGYVSISISTSLAEALLANRIAYLGSVFLPFCMVMTIMDACKISYKKIVTVILLSVSIVVFLIAASPGYLKIYYENVTLLTVNGVSTLVKEYGPLHFVYLIYLLSYFAIMLSVITYSVIKKKITSGSHVTILASAVLCNIAVWGIEQIIDIQFEFLSISYIITELFLLMLFVMIQNTEDSLQGSPQPEDAPKGKSENGYEYFLNNLSALTPAEKKVYDLYVAGKNTRDVMELLNITENTLKTHNKKIYQKLGVSSRKEMLSYVNYEKEQSGFAATAPIIHS